LIAMTQAILKPKLPFLSNESPDPLKILTIIVLRKHSHVVKPRDVRKFYGYDHGIATHIGIILNALVKAGLAKRLNNAKPRRYFIKSWVADWIVTYGFRCFRKLHCPHINDCPIREALKGVIRRED